MYKPKYSTYWTVPKMRQVFNLCVMKNTSATSGFRQNLNQVMAF